MPLPDIQISSETFLLCAIVTAGFDVALMWILAGRISPDRFRRLRWPIFLASGMFWISLGMLLFALAWESYYAKFLPDLGHRSLGRSMVELLPYPLMGLLLWWLATRLPGNRAVSFCLLGGLESVPEHLWGIYALGMLDKVSFLKAANPVAVLAFALFEYILYWGTVLSIALFIESAWQRCKGDIMERKRGTRNELHTATVHETDLDDGGRGAGTG